SPCGGTATARRRGGPPPRSCPGLRCRPSSLFARFTPMSRKPRPESTRARPAHVTLAVVLQVREARLQVLLWQRAREPFLGAWSLPGGYLDPAETLEESIRRHLAVKVDVRELAHLEQLETLSDPARNPLEWEL